MCVLFLVYKTTNLVDKFFAPKFAKTVSLVKKQWCDYNRAHHFYSSFHLNKYRGMISPVSARILEDWIN